MQIFTIKNQIIFIIAISAALTGIIAFQGIQALNTLNRKLDRIVTIETERVALSLQLRTEMVELQRTEKNLILALSREEMNEYEEKFSQHAHQVDQLITRLRVLVDDMNKTKLDHIKITYQEYLATFEKIRRFIRDHMKQQPESQMKAIQLSRSEARQLLDSIEKRLAEVSNYNERTMAEISQDTSTLYNVTRNSLIWFAVLSIGTTLTIGVITLRRILKRISTMVGFANSVAAGDYESKIDDPSHDELRQLSDALNQMMHTLLNFTKELARSNQYKSDFLASMSHELRTPLNSLIVLSHTLTENEEGNLTEQQLECLYAIHSSGHELLTLINDILDLAKIEAGKIVLHPEKVRMEELWAYAKRTYQPLAEKKGLTFFIEIDAKEQLPPYLFTDLQRVKQIIKNFLSNALKFTETGNITFRLYRPTEEELAESVLKVEETIAIAIVDTGVGIPREKQELIFDAFQQADSRASQNGTGLGLSIARKIAALLGGKIGFQSQENKGSVFILYLPEHLKIIDGDQPIEAPIISTRTETGLDYPKDTMQYHVEIRKNQDNDREPQKNDKEFSLKGKKLLLVDDDMRNVFALINVFKEKDIKVFVESNGKKAIKCLRDHPDIDLVLMDIIMPEMDGYEAIREIRKQEIFHHLPIIALTATAMPGDREKCFEAGANDYLSKPVDTHQMLSAIQHWVQ